jgi:hypothetical protein
MHAEPLLNEKMFQFAGIDEEVRQPRLVRGNGTVTVNAPVAVFPHRKVLSSGHGVLQSESERCVLSGGIEELQ